MRRQDERFDHLRYQQLLADAVDETKRLALIALLIEERAMDRLAAQRASDHAALTVTTIGKVLGGPALGASRADSWPVTAPAPAPPPNRSSAHFGVSLTMPGNRS
jgi:hypothetical protein